MVHGHEGKRVVMLPGTMTVGMRGADGGFVPTVRWCG